MTRHRRSVRSFHRRLSFALLSVVALAATTDARAHVVMGAKSLHLRVAEASIVLRGRVSDPDAMYVASDGKTRRALVVVDVLETLKGDPGGESVRIAQDGHAVATYQTGDVALFFLKPIGRSLELRSLAVPGGATHVSGQEHDEAFVIEGPGGATLLAATRAFVASEKTESADERVALIRAATLDLLTSGDDRLATAALASLVLAPEAEWITPDDLPRLHSTIADASNSIGLRAGLIDELERRGLVAGDLERLALLRSAAPGELPSAIRALAPKSGPRVLDFLLELVALDSDASPTAVAEAAIALGASRDPRVLAPLSDAAMRPEQRVRNAVIRGLGLSDEARAAQLLSEISSSHPDPGTRKRAAAELRKTRHRTNRGR